MYENKPVPVIDKTTKTAKKPGKVADTPGWPRVTIPRALLFIQSNQQMNCLIV